MTKTPSIVKENELCSYPISDQELLVVHRISLFEGIPAPFDKRMLPNSSFYPCKCTIVGNHDIKFNSKLQM